MAIRWRATECWLGSLVNFQGIRTSIAKKPYILWFFRGWGRFRTSAPPLDPRMRDMYTQLPIVELEALKMLCTSVYVLTSHTGQAATENVNTIDERGSNSLETKFSIAICRPTLAKNGNQKHCFHRFLILVRRLLRAFSIVAYPVCYCFEYTL